MADTREQTTQLEDSADTSVERAMVMAPRTCAIIECGRPSKTLGLCAKHYARIKKKRSVTDYAPACRAKRVSTVTTRVVESVKTALAQLAKQQDVSPSKLAGVFLERAVRAHLAAHQKTSKTELQGAG